MGGRGGSSAAQGIVTRGSWHPIIAGCAISENIRPMSRAFVNEDAYYEPEPKFTLPPRGSPHYSRAAAHAMLDGANAGYTSSAEKATGYEWGDPILVPHMEALMAEADSLGDARTVTLCRRYLRAAAPSVGE